MTSEAFHSCNDESDRLIGIQQRIGEEINALFERDIFSRILDDGCISFAHNDLIDAGVSQYDTELNGYYIALSKRQHKAKPSERRLTPEFILGVSKMHDDGSESAAVCFVYKDENGVWSLSEPDMQESESLSLEKTELIYDAIRNPVPQN